MTRRHGDENTAPVAFLRVPASLLGDAQWGFFHPATGIAVVYDAEADLEGSGVEVLDLLLVRDTMQAILHRLTPDEALPTSLEARLDDLEARLREERSTFLMVEVSWGVGLGDVERAVGIAEVALDLWSKTRC